VRHDLRLSLLAATGPATRLPAEAIHRQGLYMSLSLLDQVTSPDVGLAKMLTLLCCMVLVHSFLAPLNFRISAWSASLITKLRRSGWHPTLAHHVHSTPPPTHSHLRPSIHRSGWHSSLAWAVGLVVCAFVTLATSQMLFGLGTCFSMFREPGGYVAADDGLSAEQLLVAKQQLVLIMATASGLRMRN
jgi:hypothetical protein